LVLNSAATCNGQGPGLVVPGVNFNFTAKGQWNGAGYFGAPSREILSNSQPLTIEFTTPVTIFAVDLRAYVGFPATATLTMYGLDDATIIGTLAPVYLSTTGVPTRVAWQDDTGIGKIVATQTGQPWSPIIDNLEFGATTAKLAFSPTSSFPGEVVTVTCSGFVANETINLVYEHGNKSFNLGTLTADGSGSAVGTQNVPKGPYGTYLVYALGQSSGLFGAATFPVTPKLLLNPNVGAPGSTSVAQGVGFGKGETVNIYWSNPRQLLGTATADNSGSFLDGSAPTITIPTGAATGLDAVFGVGQSTKAIGKGWITVQ
jgi:hypothetical protein